MSEQTTIALINVVPLTIGAVATLLGVWAASPKGRLFRRLSRLEKVVDRHRNDRVAHPSMNHQTRKSRPRSLRSPNNG